MLKHLLKGFYPENSFRLLNHRTLNDIFQVLICGRK